MRNSKQHEDTLYAPRTDWGRSRSWGMILVPPVKTTEGGKTNTVFAKNHMGIWSKCHRPYDTCFGCYITACFGQQGFECVSFWLLYRHSTNFSVMFTLRLVFLIHNHVPDNTQCSNHNHQFFCTTQEILSIINRFSWLLENIPNSHHKFPSLGTGSDLWSLFAIGNYNVHYEIIYFSPNHYFNMFFMNLFFYLFNIY